MGRYYHGRHRPFRSGVVVYAISQQVIPAGEIPEDFSVVVTGNNFDDLPDDILLIAAPEDDPDSQANIDRAFGPYSSVLKVSNKTNTEMTFGYDTPHTLPFNLILRFIVTPSTPPRTISYTLPIF